MSWTKINFIVHFLTFNFNFIFFYKNLTGLIQKETVHFEHN